MQNLWCKRKSILFSWLISYTILLLIPLLISGIVYIQSVKTISDEINRANGALLDQWQQTMDSRIRDIYQLALQLGWNQNVQGIIYVREPLKGTHHYTIHKIINDIKFYRTANEFISNIYLYIKNIDSILTPSARYESELFFEHYHNCGDMTYYQWLNVLRNRYFKKYVTLPTKRDDQTISESIACIQSIPIENPHMPMATVIILIDKSQIFSTIQNNKLLQQGIVLILNKEDEIIFSSEPIDLSDSIKYSNLSKKHGLIESHLNGEKITVSYISSQFNDWKYISIIPSKIFMEKARYIYRLITLSLFLCLLLGGIFTFIFTKKNYNPVQSLVNLLIKKSGISIKQIYNEYDFINNAISNTLDEKEKIQKKLQQQAVTLKTNFLIQLLKGKINENLPIDDALATYGIDFISDCFVVMLIYIDDYGNFLNNEKLVSANQNIDLVHFIIKNVIEELTSKNHRSFVVEIDDMLACLVNLNEIHSDNWKNESIQIAQKAQKWLEENFNIYVSISVSQVCDSIDNISMAYQQALKAMEYRIVVGYKNIIHYDSISASSFSNSSYYYPIEVEQ